MPVLSLGVSASQFKPVKTSGRNQFLLPSANPDYNSLKPGFGLIFSVMRAFVAYILHDLPYDSSVFICFSLGLQFH